jgi:hypothetical protein
MRDLFAAAAEFPLRKWFTRYQVYGIEGLKDKSRRLHHFPTAKVY